MSSSTVSITSKAQFDGLLRDSQIVVAEFYDDDDASNELIEPIYESLSASLSRASEVTFVKIDAKQQATIAQAYNIQALPHFVIFRDGKVKDKVQGSDSSKLQTVVRKLALEVESLGEGSGGGDSGEPWKGADIPRGYSDITDQIELKGLELLNADSDAGPVRVLFESSKPSALNKGKGAKKDWVQSGADDQLLLFIPFQAIVKLHTLQLTSLPPQDEDDAPMRPGTIHIYINRPQNMDFGEADDTEPTQAVELTSEDWNDDGTVNINLRFVKFTKTSSIIIYVQKGDGDGETVRLDRLKLIGEAGTKREMGKLQKVGDEE
ncbi:hypothetical protein G7046_g3302 [Stylonectria norvegica]|nr:hypothetical protein G7046_g3302 [Stylonectria norvegica]